MKKFTSILSAAVILTSPAISHGDTLADMLGPDNIFTGSPSLMLAGSINPYWGAGTGFHYVQPRSGSGYWRSNPDGLCWNNKYGC